MRGRILIVEDEREFGALLETALRAQGFEPAWRESADAALAAMGGGHFDVVVTDIHLKESSGLDLCSVLTRNWPDLPVVIITGFGSMEAAVSAIRAGAYDFIVKPFEAEHLGLVLERAVRHRALHSEVKRLRSLSAPSERFGAMVGGGVRMRRLFDELERVAGSDAAILIQGESGTGKELVARSLHERSRRASGPFVALNCAAMPEQLIESELFGHARGAFTDAKSERVGLFVQASGGTLFLDEVGDLGPGLQPKLLRALQERRVRPVGSGQEVAFDARIVAATHRDLEFEVEAGRFREDLYFRLNVIRVDVPPLRERGDDILLLAQHFLNEIAAREGKPVRGLAQTTAERLLDYPWPGNVRELSNAIERAVAMTDHDLLLPEDLPERVRRTLAPRALTSLPTTAANEGRPLTVEEVERRHILGVLNECGGNKSLAARLLGLDRRTLYRKLETFGAGES
ncbi:MAG: sigma-54 dependent transcriptional regulator [Candidatus Eisenbacteria bacterium]